jgi:hypothetical protein
MSEPELHDWPIAGEFERMLGGLATHGEGTNEDRAIRLTVNTSDSIPRDPLYAEVLDKKTGVVQRLNYMFRTNRFAGGESHLFVDELSRIHLAVILRDDKDYSEGLHLVPVSEDQAAMALQRPVGFLRGTNSPNRLPK